MASDMSLQLLHELCSLPTAPFVEGRVVEYVERFAKQRRLKLSRDAFGNLLLELPTRSRAPRWVFTAHMDHPGLVATRMRSDGRTLEAAFRGWVLANS
jgi:putative aminopeptidase FrvX